MNKDESGKAYHEEARKFPDALRHTALATGFSERLLEKDYYCSLVLKDLEVLFKQGFVFKGGTCLSKVHAEFFRLSEALDFGVSLQPDTSRRVRRDIAEPIKRHLAGIVARLPFFSEMQALTGQNNSKQYNGRLAYRSVVTGSTNQSKSKSRYEKRSYRPRWH